MKFKNLSKILVLSLGVGAFSLSGIPISANAESGPNELIGGEEVPSVKLTPESLNLEQKKLYDEEVEKGNDVEIFQTKQGFTVITSVSTDNQSVSPFATQQTMNLAASVYHGYLKIGYTTGYMNISRTSSSASINSWNVTPYSYTGTAWNDHFTRGSGSNPAILNHKFTLKVNYPAWGMQQLSIPFYGTYKMYPSGKLSIDIT